MTEDQRPESPDLLEMRNILDRMLANDADISARAVARQHTKITAASSVTRNDSRRQLLAEYQQRQSEYRRWRGRAAKQSGSALAGSLAEKDLRIAELETKVQLLTGAHLALLRVVGELGGFNVWAKFYEQYSDARGKLTQLGAVPTPDVIPLDTARRKEVYPKGKNSRKAPGFEQA